MMAALLSLALVQVFCAGICMGASAVEEDEDGDLRLPAGWWVAPAALSAVLFWGVFVWWVL